MNLPNLIGLIGVVIEIVAYALVSGGQWTSKQPRYQIANIIGTAMILYSLLYAWNLPSVVLQTTWIFFSVVGLMRVVWQRRSAR